MALRVAFHTGHEANARANGHVHAGHYTLKYIETEADLHRIVKADLIEPVLN
jgi:hypothetical protein